MRIRTMSIVPTLFLGVEYCATFQAALYIETHSLMHQSEFHAASVALSRAADKRKSHINIHKNGYTATLIIMCFLISAIDRAAQCNVHKLEAKSSLSQAHLLVSASVKFMKCWIEH